MEVQIYPKLIVEVATGGLTWPRQASQAARRVVTDLLRDRPGWTLTAVHYHDDEGAHNA